MKHTLEAFIARARVLQSRPDNSAYLANLLAVMIDSLFIISQAPGLDSAQKLNLFVLGHRDKIGPPLSAEEYDLLAAIFGMDGLELFSADPTARDCSSFLSPREAALARGYFQRGLELGRLQGALEDRTRREAKGVRSKQSSARKNKGIWAPFKPELQDVVRGYVEGKSLNDLAVSQVSALASIKAKIGRAPAASTLSEWIANYRTTGDIFDNSLRADRYKAGQ